MRARGIVGADGSALRPRPRPHRPRRHRGRGLPALARPGAARRALGLPPLLAGRAPQHAGHRQRRHRGADRATSPPAPRASASAPAASCCPTTRRCRWPSSSATLEALFPGRIDLGLGRAPGTDPAAAMALRRTLALESRRLSRRRARADGATSREPQPGQAGAGGARRRPARCRSGSSARAPSARRWPPALGLPFAFASHFAPALLDRGAARSTASASRRRHSSPGPT